MKKTLCILFLGYCTVVNTYAQTLASVTSPDGSIVLQINGKDNNLSYNVKKGGNTVLVEAPIKQKFVVAFPFYLQILIKQMRLILLEVLIL